MQDIQLKAATYKDLGTISELATTIWNQHYPAIISQTQIDYMLDLMYSSESLATQIDQKKHQFYLIRLNEMNCGFISVNKENNKDWFLNKFYIDQNTANKGIGKVSFFQLLEIIKPEKISLTVNRKNFKSINFYFKLGFKIERVADFDIGHGYVMNDFVMVWQKA